MRDTIRTLLAQYEPMTHLAIKTLKVQYRRPVFGFFWAFLMPIITAIIFKIVFSHMLRIEVKPYPFFVYFLTAIFPWSYFQSAAMGGTMSMLDNRDLVSEASIEREIIPLSVVYSHLINFLPAVPVIVIMCLMFGVGISPYLLLLPFVITLHTLFIAGFVLCTSCLYVRFRDLRYIVEIVCMVNFYFTPVFYPLTLVREYLDGFLFRLYLLNPFVGILNLYRLCFLPNFLETLPEECTIFFVIIVPALMMVGVFLIGLYIFSKFKKAVYDNVLV